MGNNFNTMISSWHFPEDEPDASQTTGLTVYEAEDIASQEARASRTTVHVIHSYGEYKAVSDKEFQKDYGRSDDVQIIASYGPDGNQL
jgi:hypothetical protein